MKKTVTLFVTAFAVSITLIAQQVTRQSVILEIGTGTWCQYCPGAAMGAEDLLNSGARIAVIKYHSGDSYANSYSSARLSYYGISSFPTAKFDGILTVAGGSSSSSMYGTYLPRYNQRAATPSSFTLDLWGQNTGGLSYSTQLLVKKVADYTGTNLVLHLVVTETNIPQVWFNQTHVKDVCRLMVPNQSGTPLNFSNKDFQVVNLNFTLNSAWVTGNIWLVAFVQDNATKEILQGHKVKLSNLLPTPLISLFTVSKRNACEGEVVEFTDHSLGNPTGWLWTLPGTATGTSNLQNPTVSYNQGGQHNVSLTVTNATSSNTLTRNQFMNITPLPSTPNTPSGDEIVDLFYTTISNYTIPPVVNATAYQWFLDPATAGSIASAGTDATITWNQSYLGQALLKVKASNGICQGEYSEPLVISIINTVGVDKPTANDWGFSPNPGKGMFTLHLPALINTERFFLQVLDIRGTEVWKTHIENTYQPTHMLDFSHLRPGLYYLKVTTGQTSLLKPFSVIK